MKKICICIIFVFFCCNTVKSQESKLAINVNIISVVYEKSVSDDGALGDLFSPLIITFHCYVTPTLEKNTFLFDSNTMKEFRKSDANKKEYAMGHFYLVNQQDSILLFSRKRGIISSPDGKSISPSIDALESPIFERFLHKFASKDTKTGKEALFLYLKESRLVYIPIIDDYVNYMDKKYATRKDKPIFPDQVIEVTMPNPFVVDFGLLYNDDIETISE